MLEKDRCLELWIGISQDEVFRVKPSRDRWITHYWPLIQEEMTRQDCRDWFSEHYPGRVLPRSACIGCPFHTNAEWAAMKVNDKESWEDAVFVDNALRTSERAERFDGEMYLHSSLRPLGQIEDFPEEHGHSPFDDECEGMCGV